MIGLIFIKVVAASPNILVLFADDMGYGDVSYGNHPTLSTPNLDTLAREGMRFTQWYSAFHICSPSRSSMMTGRLPIRTGVIGGWQGGVFGAAAIGGLPLNETTWAQLVSERGYRTMCIGKWHLGQQPKHLPTRFGFDQYLGIPYSVDMGDSPWHAAPTQTPLPLVANETVIEQPVNLNTLSERYVAAALNFVADDKFALYYAFSHVHVPDFASPQFCNTSRRGRYGDAVAEMDWSIGQVMAAVPTDTLTFFTSDNGPWLIEDLSGGSAGLFFEGKSTTWEGGVRVPGIVHWPNNIKPGFSFAVVATYDIFSTVLAATDAQAPSDRIIDGRDLSGILLDTNSSEVRDCVFIYKGRPDTSCPDTMPDGCPGLWAVRCGKYKAHFVTSYTVGTCQGAHPVINCNGSTFWDPPLLFDLEFDPSEKWPVDNTTDLYNDTLTTILAAKLDHEANLDLPAYDQILLGQNQSLAVCGCPDSQTAYPQYPNCTCNPENWETFVCAPLGPTNQIDAIATDFELQYGYRPW